MKQDSSPLAFWLRKTDAWLNAKRVSHYPWMFVFLFYGLWIFWVSTGTGLLDRNGKPIWSDFLTLYSGSLFAHTEAPENAYRLEPFHEVQKEVVGAGILPLMWRYPPPAFLLAWPLSLLPYLPACLLWLGSTSALYCFLVRKFAPLGLTLLLTVAFSGFYQNWIQGQNACFTASLLAGGLLLSEKRPWLAGLLLGLLVYKPQYGVLIPFYLVCRKDWKTFFSTALTSLAVIFASLAVYGLEPWMAFKESLGSTLWVVEQGYDPIEKLITLYGSLVLLGIPAGTAKALHALLAVAVVLAACWKWLKSSDLQAGIALLICGTLLITPYAYDYEFAFMAFPLAWLAFHLYRNGSQPGDKTFCAFLWIAPFGLLLLSKLTGLQLGWLALVLLFLKIHRLPVNPAY